MINLLPGDVKADYHYARRTVGLRRWVTAFVAAFVGLGIIATYGLLAIHQQTVRYNQEIVASQDLLKKQNFTETQTEVKTIGNNFKLVIKVLSNEVLFSELIQQIASTIPTNANLTNLNINKSQGALDISAIATDYTTATQVQINLSDPTNKIFSKADLVSVSCANNTTTPTAYPCSVTVHALFAADNPFLFINSTAKAKAKS
jgi:hypothetical protein